MAAAISRYEPMPRPQETYRFPMESSVLLYSPMMGDEDILLVISSICGGTVAPPAMAFAKGAISPLSWIMKIRIAITGIIEVIPLIM